LRLAGTAYGLAEDGPPARVFWAQSLALGQHIDARPELARTRLEVAKHLPPSEMLAGYTAREHRAQALQAFEDLGLAWDLAAAAASGTVS
jgi:hypothetical protein